MDVVNTGYQTLSAGGRRFRWMLHACLIACMLLLPAWTHGMASPRESLSRALELLNQGSSYEGTQLLFEITDELRNERQNAEALVVLGRAHFYLEQDGSALGALSRAIEVETDHSEAHFFSGLIHLYASNYDEAIRSFQYATEYAPEVGSYWLELGRAFTFAGRNKEALEAYERTIELNPEQILALYNSGAILSELQRDAEALERFLMVLAVDPGHARASYAAGRMLHNLGHDREALSYFERVVALDPEDWHVRELIIQIHQALGEYELRDNARSSLIELRRSGKLPDLAAAPYYIRDRFRYENRSVYVLEFFDLQGDTPIRYLFQIFDSNQRNIMEISLGSYEFTRTISKELGVEGADELFHLDAYWPDGSHAAYQFYIPEPAYDIVRNDVLAVLADELSAMTSFSPSD